MIGAGGALGGDGYKLWILMVVMFPLMHVYLHTHQVVHIKYIQL